MTLRLVPPPFPPRSPKPKELPTRWDEAGNRQVSWTDWRPPTTTFICPPPPPEEWCPGCKTLLPEEMATGYIQGRTRYIRLVAFRCIGCGHCSIYDEHTKQLWDLP